MSVPLGVKEVILASGHTVGGWARKDSVGAGLAQVSASVIYVWDGEKEGKVHMLSLGGHGTGEQKAATCTATCCQARPAGETRAFPCLRTTCLSFRMP